MFLQNPRKALKIIIGTAVRMKGNKPKRKKMIKKDKKKCKSFTSLTLAGFELTPSESPTK